MGPTVAWIFGADIRARRLSRSSVAAPDRGLDRSSDVLRVLVVLALVAGNAFFVIGEYAVVTARRSALAPRAEAGHAGARAALRLMDDPVRVISTVQVGITAIGILTGAIAEPLVRDLLGQQIPSWLAFILSFGIVTYLSVVLGELVPKALTIERAETMASLVAPPIELMARVLSPVVWVLQGSASLLLRPFGIQDVVAGESIRTADELRAAGRRGRGRRRDPARPGGAPAQRVRLRDAARWRRDGPVARRGLARRQP